MYLAFQRTSHLDIRILRLLLCLVIYENLQIISTKVLFQCSCTFSNNHSSFSLLQGGNIYRIQPIKSGYLECKNGQRSDLFRPSWPKGLTHGSVGLNIKLSKETLAACEIHRSNLLAMTGKINRPCSWD